MKQPTPDDIDNMSQQQSIQTTYTNDVRVDHLNHLARVWSKCKNTHIITSLTNKGFSTLITKDSRGTILIPQLPMFSGDLTQDFNIWRLFRFETFHESLHIWHTPHINPDILPKEHAKDKFIFQLFNALEDYRIEKISLRTYTGYYREQRFRDQYYLKKNAKEYTRLKHSLSTVRIAGLYILDSLRSISKDTERDTNPMYEKLSPELLTQLKALIPEFQDIETTDQAIESTFKFSKLFPDEPDFRDQYNERKENGSTSQELDPNSQGLNMVYIQAPGELDTNTTPGQKIQTSEASIRGSLEAVEKILQQIDSDETSPTEELKVEFKSLCDQYTQQMKIAKTPIIRSNSSDIGRYNTLKGAVQRETLDMKQRLKKWTIGWDEHLDTEGEDFDPEAYISCSDKYFNNEERISNKTDLYILVDNSGSVSQYENQYIMSLAIICEALTTTKIKYEMLYFGHKDQIRMVKERTERFTDQTRALLGGFDADKLTPLGRALGTAITRCKANNIKRILFISDGIASDKQEAIEQSKIAHRSGISIYGIAYIQSDASMRERVIKDYNDILGPQRRNFKIISHLSLLPQTFFNLIKE
ncbi:MAG: vWA domain-containing protein [Candidatus Paceibacterota bacterium]